MGFRDGTALMRASFELVRRDPELLWFPLISACCLALTAAFWIFEEAWLYAVHGPWLLFIPFAAAGLYSLAFVAVFFSVALVGSAAEAVDGGEPSLADGINIAWARLGGIAGWAAYSIFVAFIIGVVSSIKGLRWVGKAAEVSWDFATIFVVPLIALEGLDARTARARSFELVKGDWRAESGGLAALRAAWLLPGLLFFLDAKLLFSGHVHSLAAKSVLGLVLLCGFALATAVGVVRQVFAVELYRA